MVSGTQGDACDVSSLPPAVQRAVHALGRVQAAMDELGLEFKKGKWQAAKEADEELQKLADQRRALLVKGGRS